MAGMLKGALITLLVLVVVFATITLVNRKGVEEPAPIQAAPLVGSSSWYIDPSSAANELLPSNPELHRIANYPRFAWFGPFTTPAKLREYVDNAMYAGKVPLITLFNVESRECGQLSAAKTFYDQTAQAINGRRAIVAFEPDSLGSMELGHQVACWNMLAYGLKKFSSLPNTLVFMEAGASDWEGPPRMQRKLRRVGACKYANGIVVNVTHADWTRNNILYAKRTLNLAGCPNKLIMVNTAENGRGPNPKSPQHWCDRYQRYGLGRPPQYPTKYPRVAFAWVNRPGYTQKCYDAPVRFAKYRADNLIAKATNKVAP